MLCLQKRSLIGFETLFDWFGNGTKTVFPQLSDQVDHDAKLCEVYMVDWLAMKMRMIVLLSMLNPK